ncbi:hypothetical protein TEMA_01550 [Terrisporobacter mayombei]|uniref:Uncharacterized protein n=1 Tax=Terrisporobacter mayombei TaxID=1541 RepID=A0ABY9PXZ0_9FIRM|nr:hypothetical protein TEMA_01550 [Terrisporobacter mayombei]
MIYLILIWILIFGIKIKFGYDSSTEELFINIRSEINYEI